jgi:hypothetical protein
VLSVLLCGAGPTTLDRKGASDVGRYEDMKAFTVVFDDVAKLLKPLHPKTFDIPSAADLRKALAEVIKDLGNIE